MFDSSRKHLSVAMGLCSLILWGAAAVAGPDISGQVMRVLGPDTLVVKGPGDVLYTVHLRGTMTGERGNPAATQTQSRLVSDLVGRRVTLTNVAGTGNRLEAVVEYGNVDLNQELIRDGMLQYDEETVSPELVDHYTILEEQARTESLGVWRPVEERPATPAPMVPAAPPEGGWKFRPLTTKP